MIPAKIIINVEDVTDSYEEEMDESGVPEIQKETARRLLEFFGRNAEAISNIFLEAYDEFDEISNEDEYCE